MAKYINPVCGGNQACLNCDKNTCPNHPKRVVYKKPPLGVIPKKQWMWLRYLELLNAITRYSNESKVAKKEWIEELEEIRGLLEDTDYGNKTTD